MIFIRKIHAGLLSGILCASAALLSGCADDVSTGENNDLKEGTPTEVTLSITALRSGETGDGTPMDPAAEKEMINIWWLAFVDNSGIVRQVITRQQTGAVEMETFKCIVPAGEYTVYAFANILPEALKSATGLEFKIGSRVTLPAGVESVTDAVWKTSLNGEDIPQLIPMSGVLDNIRVRDASEEMFSIEVVRMVAKMEFRFSNPGDKAITVHGVSVDPVTVTPISLFPRGEEGISYGHLGYFSYTPLDGAEYDRILVPFASDNVVAAGEEEKSMTIYLQESISGRENDEAFTIGIKVSHQDGVSEFQQYNITHDILSYINRNDHILIPVTLSRYDVDVDAVFYPPIGGYPAVASSLDPDGSQIFTFSSEGDFSVVAHVTDKQTGSHLAPHYYSVTVSDITDPNSIFSVSPSVISATSSLPDEVTGKLSAFKGKGTFKITVSIFDKARYQSDAKVIASYTRDIYIIRK